MSSPGYTVAIVGLDREALLNDLVSYLMEQTEAGSMRGDAPVRYERIFRLALSGILSRHRISAPEGRREPL